MEECAGGEKAGARPSPCPVMNGGAEIAQRNLEIACALQHRVIEKLRRSGKLGKISAGEAAALLITLTREVCAGFDPGKPL